MENNAVVGNKSTRFPRRSRLTKKSKIEENKNRRKIIWVQWSMENNAVVGRNSKCFPRTLLLIKKTQM